MSYVETRRTVVIAETPLPVPDFFLHPEGHGLARYTEVDPGYNRSKNLAEGVRFLDGFHLHAGVEAAALAFFARGSGRASAGGRPSSTSRPAAA
jgi:hypothetical protein